MMQYVVGTVKSMQAVWPRIREALRVEGRDDRAHLELRILSGTHAGTRYPCRAGQALVLGSASPADLVLTERDLAPAHCLLRADHAHLEVQPLEGELPEGLPERSRSLRVGHFRSVRLSDRVTVALGAAEGERWGELVSDVERPAPATRRTRRWYATTAGATGLLVISALLAGNLGRKGVDVETPAPADPARVAAEVAPVGTRVIREDGIPVLTGIVDDEEELNEITEALRRRGVADAVRLSLRTGDDVASDVQEVLRLSGIRAKASYGGDGQVRVSGAFDDETSLDDVIGSRAMVEIRGLEQVVVEGLPQTRTVRPPPRRHIVTVHVGSDPYLITDDGSRYYLGARMPDGGVLHEIAADRILVRKDGALVVIDTGDARVAGTRETPRTLSKRNTGVML